MHADAHISSLGYLWLYGKRANGEDGVRPRWITFFSFHNSSHHTQPHSIIIVHYYSLWILCRFWLALTIFGRCEQYTIDLMVYLPGNEAAWVNSELKKWRSRLSEDKIAEFLNKPKRKKCKNTQNILLNRCYLLFCGVSARTKISLYTETLPRNRPSFWRMSTRR